MAIHKVVSIEIGLAKTRVCETDFRKKNPKVYKCVVFDTPENTIEDAFIRDKKAFAEALKAELEKAEIKCKNFLFSMNCSKILSREVTIPKVKDAQIGGIIEGQKDEYFPMDISECKLAYSILAEDKENNQYRMVVYAVPESLIKNYFNLVEELDGKLVGLDYAGNSVYQWVKKAAVKDTKPIEMILQMNVQNTLAMILENGVMSLSRNISFGTNNVAEALKAASGDETLTTTECYNRLRLEKIIKDRFNEGDTEQEHEMSDQEWLKMVEVQDSVTEALRPLIVNINRVIEYYSTKNKNARIPEIKFFGLGTRMTGLSNLIANEIGLPVITVTELSDLAFSKGAGDRLEQSSDLIACLGASIETIHFIDVAFDSDKKQGNELTGMYILLVISIIAAAALVIFSRMNYKKALEERDALAKEYDSKVYINKTEAEYTEKQTVLSEITDVDNNTYTYNEEMNGLLAELESMLPSSTIVHTFTSAGDVFMMTVTVADKTTAAKLIMQLQEVKYVSVVSISAISETSDDISGESEVSFTVTCTYMRPTEEDEQ